MPWPAVTTSARAADSPASVVTRMPVAVARDRGRLDALERPHAALAQHARERARDGGQVDDAAVEVEVGQVGVQVGEARAQRVAPNDAVRRPRRVSVS